MLLLLLLLLQVASVVSNSVRPHRRQPTRLPCPWDSPSKNTGVGCHFLLQCMKVKVKSLSRIRLLVTPWTAAYQAPPSMGFSRQEYWSRVPSPSPEISWKYVKTSQSWFLSPMWVSSEAACQTLPPFLPQHSAHSRYSGNVCWVNEQIDEYINDKLINLLGIKSV